MTNAAARFNKSLRPRKPEGSLGRTAQDVHLDSHTAPELRQVGLRTGTRYTQVGLRKVRLHTYKTHTQVGLHTGEVTHIPDTHT